MKGIFNESISVKKVGLYGNDSENKVHFVEVDIDGESIRLDRERVDKLITELKEVGASAFGV